MIIIEMTLCEGSIQSEWTSWREIYLILFLCDVIIIEMMLIEWGVARESMNRREIC